MASSIVLINIKGEVLIYRGYKYDVTRQETMEFTKKIIATKESKEKPIVLMSGVSYIHILEGEILLLATTKSNTNPAMIINFLYSFVNICKSYFQKFDEASIKNNFVLIYELLDEIMDYGYPQITDPNLLKKYITQGGFKSDFETNLKLVEAITAISGQVSWRQPNIIHKENEVWIDVIENTNLLLSKSGELIKSEVMGTISVRSNLSGWPECKFGMNDKLQLNQNSSSNKNNNNRGISIEDIRFHQCVRLSDFNRDRTITFIPPDGIFDLMTYRVSENVIIPFKIFCNIIETPFPDNKAIPQSIDLDLSVKALFDKLYFAENVVVKIPIPKNATNVKTNSSLGKAKYESDKGAIIWRIKKIFGDKDCKLKCEIQLLSVKDPQPWSKAPISMEFNIPMFTSTGLRVRYLKITDKSGYVPHKWIRYVTKAGDFQFRI
jgi:AP-2 complex subunit mu-1